MIATASTIGSALKLPAVLALAVLLGACAGLSPEAGLADVQQLAQGRTAGVTAALAPDADTAQARVAELLSKPLDSDAAVRIALLNNPGLHGALATLQVSDADRVQAARLPNPHISLGRFKEGQTVEIERLLRFDVIGLLSLPWRAQWQGQQHELAKLAAAQDVIRLAADTRKAWLHAVAAQQRAAYMADVREAAEASAELARRMARVGNWSRLRQAREQLMLADLLAQLTRARHQVLVERERLVRLLGLWGEQTSFKLPERLPDLPAVAVEQNDIEARALRERLDVRAAIAESGYLAGSLGLVKASGFINALELGYQRSTIFDNGAGSKETRRGWEIELALPLFDFGGAKNARAEAIYRQSVARVREVALRARSEARQAWHGYRTAHDLARHYQDEIGPLRKFIHEETLLRYNGMLASVWDLLAETRAQAQSVIGAIEAQRDFWLAEADLQTALSGTSPGGLAGLRSGVSGGAGEAAEAH
jgi:multidrug efflux system outer membrane protein